MWIRVLDGTKSLWVESDECCLSDGDLAFVGKSGVITPPCWLEAPAGSIIRYANEPSAEGLIAFEHRSGSIPVEELLAFYAGCIERGSLMRKKDPIVPGSRGRCCPGFPADNDEFSFCLNLYQHRELMFWSVFLWHRNRRSKAFTAPLQLLRKDAEGVALWIPYRNEECWAPIASVRTSRPNLHEYLNDLEKRQRRRELIRSIAWSTLPAWVQFTIPAGSLGRTRTFEGESGTPECWVEIGLQYQGDPYAALESCLDSLDSYGFDASGQRRPNHSYYVSLWQQGQSIGVHVISETGDQAILSLLHSVISLRFNGPGWYPVEAESILSGWS